MSFLTPGLFHLAGHLKVNLHWTMYQNFIINNITEYGKIPSFDPFICPSFDFFSAESIAAINAGVQVSIWALASILWAIYLLVESLDHMAILCLTF